MPGGGGGDTTTIQKADPWSGQQPYLLDIFAQAQKQFQGSGPSYFPGSTVAGFSPDTLNAQTMARGMVGQQQQIAGMGSQNLQNLGAAIDPNSNPYFQNAVQGAIRPVMQQFTDPGGPLASIRSGFGQAGQYGSSRQGIAEGVAAGRLGQSVMDMTAQMGSTAYGQGLDANARAAALTPGVMQAQAMPSTTLDAIGQQNQGMNQAFINDAMARFNYDQQLPGQKLAQYQNLVQGSFGGNMSATAEGGNQNSMVAGVGGAATGYGLAYLMGANPMIGAGVGLMLSLFA